MAGFSEGVWTLTKRALANGRPDSLAVLIADVVTQLERLRRGPTLLRTCILQSELPFRLS